MLFIIGSIVVIVCVLGGFVINGGEIPVLWQPAEFLIILGSATGAFIIANPKEVLGKMGYTMGKAVKGISVKKRDYLDLLCILYLMFKVARSKGALALESHIENPNESTIFNAFPNIHHHEHELEFFRDYMRLITLGNDNPYVMEDLMNAEIDTHHAESHQLAAAIQTVADGTPALGIVAAVLGVIHTMGSINAPPAILGHLIGGALVGTFAGVLIAYGFVGPIASASGTVFASESRMLECMKVGILAHLKGSAPQVSVEFARKSIESYFRPSFEELETELNSLPSLS